MKCFQALEEGNNDEVAKWLKSIPPDRRKEKINTAKSPFSFSRRALHVAAQGNQLETAKILLNEGAGIIIMHNQCVY
jgi:hypothetical protein